MLLSFALLGVLTSTVFALPNPVVFVAQVPQPADFATILSTFANQMGGIYEAPRGGGLMIVYPDGTVRDLTAAAGYGQSGMQGAQAIAVRDPAVHWDGSKVIFSMVIGAPTARYQVKSFYWQLFEITSIGQNETPTISKVLNQPDAYNNIMPTYATDDQIIFVTDRPRNGARHLYPQRDEYESTATNTGVWKLHPTSGALTLLDHAPSGAFNPIIDTAGRIVYTRWDHLQRDQQAGGLTSYGAFNFSDESATASKIETQAEIFPEPRSNREERIANVNLHTINHFFPWQLNQDGTGHETLNHVGRHELHSYFDKTFNNDSALSEFYTYQGSRTNENAIQNFFHIREDPTRPGIFYGIDAPEFGTHTSGQIVALVAPNGLTAEKMQVVYVTHRATSNVSDTPSANHSGLYRSPLPLSDGSLVASHTSETREDRNAGTATAPQSRYDLRIKLLQKINDYFVPHSGLTTGIQRTVSYWSPDVLITYTGPLWEVQPVELIARARPVPSSQHLQSPEQQIFNEEGVDTADFINYLRQQNLAVIVSRNVTTRDVADKQQPFNLRVPNGVESKVGTGSVYDVSALQIFQGDQIRGYNTGSWQAGRRILPQFLKGVSNPTVVGLPESSVAIASDGSLAAFVPAQRALTWQLTDANSVGIVRERYWLTFQPGEIRLCASCHGVNHLDQKGRSEPMNSPQALRSLVRYWKGLPALPDPVPSPTPIAQPPDSVQPSTFKIATQKKKVVVNNVWLAGFPALTLINRANSASRATTVRYSLSGKKCGELNFSVGSQERITVRTKLPKVQSAQRVTIDLLENNKILSTRTTALKSAQKRSKNKRLQRLDSKKLCSALHHGRKT